MYACNSIQFGPPSFDMKPCNIYLKLETWAGGEGGGEKGRLDWRGFREGDEGIRVREW